MKIKSKENSSKKSPQMVHNIIHLTDLHLSTTNEAPTNPINTTASFAAVVTDIKKNISIIAPELIVITGDIAEDYSRKTYEFVVQSLREFSLPIAVVPGNHDDVILFNKIFTDANYYLSNRIINLGAWQILLLNSHIEGETVGRLAPEVLAFTEQALKNHPEKFTIIFLHHHVVAVGYGIDALILQNRQEFLTLLDNCNINKQIKAIFSGHVHQENFCTQDEIEFVTTPATSYQFSRNFPMQKLFNEPPGYRIIKLFENGICNSEVVRLISYKK